MNKVEAAVKIVSAVADAIRELGEVPSGHLYAHLSGFMSLDDYNAVIGFLKSEGFVREENHLLTWVKEN